MTVTFEKLLDPPETVMMRLEAAGYYTQDSVIPRTGYVVVNGRVVILKGQYGAAELCKVEDLRKFAKELTDMADILEYRKRAGVKGA